MSDYKPIITDEELAEMKAAAGRAGVRVSYLLRRGADEIEAQRREIERLYGLVRRNWSEKVQPLIEDCEAAERLDANDFSLRVGEPHGR